MITAGRGADAWRLDGNGYRYGHAHAGRRQRAVDYQR